MGFHRQGQPAALDRAGLTDIVTRLMAEELAFLASTADPFAIDHDCRFFAKAMNASIKRGREKVKFETFVDSTPPIGHIRIRGDTIFSSCGSPAAMCTDVGSHHGGAATLK